jgi:hypothetical protein
VKQTTRTKAVDPATLRRGDSVSFGRSKAVFTVERLDERRKGVMFLIVHGPLGSASSGVMGGGQAFYVGPKTTTEVSVVTGKRRRLKPETVRLVTPQRKG